MSVEGELSSQDDVIVCILCQSKQNEIILFYNHLEKLHCVQYDHDFIFAVSKFDNELKEKIVKHYVPTAESENEIPRTAKIKTESQIESEENGIENNDVNREEKSLEENQIDEPNPRLDALIEDLEVNPGVDKLGNNNLTTKNEEKMAQSLPYKCKICEKKFQFRKSVEVHSLSRHKIEYVNKSSNKLECASCKIDFSHLSGLRRHNLRNHRASEREIAKNTEVSINTDKNNTPNIGHKSEVISDSNKLPPSPSSHKENSEETFDCSYCKKSFQSKLNLSIHKSLHQLGDNLDKSKSKLVSEVPVSKKSSEENSYSCNQCEYKSKFNYNLKKHIRQVHNNERRFMCDLCSKTYKNKISVGNHKELVHEKIEIMCDVCGRSFLTKMNLRRHKRKLSCLTKMNLRRHKRKLSCGECDRKFPCQSKLNLHMQIQHNGILPYACDQCDKKYKYSVCLKNHKLVHSSIATFNCDHCIEKFISKRTLVRHLNDSHNIQTHKKHIRTRPKTHMCQVCSKYFRGISELKRHEVVHTGERNHICHICNKAFSQKKQMKDHINQHLAGNLDRSGFQRKK